MRAAYLAAPIAFTIGLFIGLGASSAFRIVRRAEYDRWRRAQGERNGKREEHG